MPLYEYRCPTCDVLFHRQCSIDKSTELQICPDCGTQLAKRFGFAYHADYREHFNTTTGTMISSKKQFREQLKVASERATLETGVYHDFVPADLSRPSDLGVTSEGLEESFRTRRDNGSHFPESKVTRWL